LLKKLYEKKKRFIYITSKIEKTTLVFAKWAEKRNGQLVGTKSVPLTETLRSWRQRPR